MSRAAPSTLPFQLQPYPSPQQVAMTKRIANRSNQRYISTICRTGPAPMSHHHITDPICLVLYIILLITTIVLFCINYFSGKLASTVNFSQLDFFQKLAYSLNQTLPQTLLSAACIVVAGLLLMGIVILIPILAGYLIILLVVSLLGLIIYGLFALDWGQVWYQLNQKQQKSAKSQSFRIALIVITCLAVIFLFFYTARRMHKLKHLGDLMSVVKIVLLANMPLLPFIMIFVLSGINCGVWVAFVKLIWNCVRMQLSQGLTISPVFLVILVPILWIWTHGFMLAISDYICQSWVLHWYFNANNQQQQNLRLNINWRSNIFRKLIRYHLGTCLYGMTISAFIPDNLIKFIKRIISNKQRKLDVFSKISYLSRYCYIQTIMECFGFCQANRQMSMLRQRIKKQIPQIYMLGHFVQENLKIFLTLGALCLWFVFTYNLDNFIGITAVDFSFGLFLIFSFVLMVGIFLQVSTNVSHLFGIVSDTAVIAYCIDCQIQRVHYQQNLPHSVPPQLKAAFQKLQLQIQVDSDAIPKNTTSVFHGVPRLSNNLQASNVQPYSPVPYSPVPLSPYNQPGYINPYPTLSVNNPASPHYNP